MKTREQLEAVGNRILNAAQSEMYLEMRFMGPALGSLGYRMDLNTRTVGTDAVMLRFNPLFLYQLYLENPVKVNRLYMHSLLHCIFRHMFTAKLYPDAELWDLSADIAAESVLDSMDYPSVRRVPSDFRTEWYERLNAELKVLTAEKIYQYFMEHPQDMDMRECLIREFHRCDHSVWQHKPETEEEIKEKQPDAAVPPEMPSGMAPEDSGKETNREKQSGEDGVQKLRAGGRQKTPEELDEEWAEKAKRLERELEMDGPEASEEKGTLARVLRFQYRKREDYRDFLRQLSVIREETVIDPDSFDYGFYHYGMELYGNMPLIEENEFREAPKVEELVIVIDTSASCQDRLVQKFLNETASILMDQESFFHHMEVRILECDDQVQGERVFTDLRAFRQFADGFTLRGGYGTDFRPAFRHVEDLQAQGALRHLRGLLYFTDGYGTYPERPMPYRTAFVFLEDEDFEESHVPDWALRLYIQG